MMRSRQNQPDEQHSLIAAAEQVRALCSVLTKVARVDLEAHLKEHGSGISAIEHGVLRHLARGVTTMAEISRLMGVAPSTLVYVVDGLVKKKLVRRGKDPKDRRREPLSLEKKGADLFARFPKQDAGSALVKSLERLSIAQRRELLLLLNDLVKGLPGSRRLYLNAPSQETGASATAAEKSATQRIEKGRRKGHE